MIFDYELHTFRSPQFQSIVNDAVTFFKVTPGHPLPPSVPFQGAGVYGLYYVGASGLYARLGELNTTDLTRPIYIGKAVAPGW